jgi:hypothetical protein
MLDQGFLAGQSQQASAPTRTLLSNLRGRSTPRGPDNGLTGEGQGHDSAGLDLPQDRPADAQNLESSQISSTLNFISRNMRHDVADTLGS